MSWSRLSGEKRVTPEASSKQELDNLRSIVQRCVLDMDAQGLSDEQRFLIAYDAARTLALMIVRASGYRPKKLGGHYNTFVALSASDLSFAQTALYLDICRLRRNDSEYDFAGGISKADADELSQVVMKFRQDAERWIAAKDASLS